MMIELVEGICPSGELNLKMQLESRGVQVRYLRKDARGFLDLSRPLKPSEVNIISQLDAVESFVE